MKTLAIVYVLVCAFCFMAGISTALAQKHFLTGVWLVTVLANHKFKKLGTTTSIPLRIIVTNNAERITIDASESWNWHYGTGKYGLTVKPAAAHHLHYGKRFC